MPGQIRAAWLARFAAKIGISSPQDGDEALVSDLLSRMTANQADFTNTFAALPGGTARDQFTDRAAFDGWAEGWQARITQEPEPETLMARTNPKVIPRNHRVEQMIAAAVAGDYAPFQRLNAALARPFDLAPEDRDLTNPPLPSEVVPATFCGT